MPRVLKFSGHSDDIFNIDGTVRNEPDEIGCSDTGAVVKVANDHGGCFVWAQYAPDETKVGTWMIGVQPLDEDIEIPDWGIRIELAKGGYSTLLTMTVPDDVRVSKP